MKNWESWHKHGSEYSEHRPSDAHLVTEAIVESKPTRLRTLARALCAEYLGGSSAVTSGPMAAYVDERIGPRFAQFQAGGVNYTDAGQVALYVNRESAVTPSEQRRREKRRGFEAQAARAMEDFKYREANGELSGWTEVDIGNGKRRRVFVGDSEYGYRGDQAGAETYQQYRDQHRRECRDQHRRYSSRESRPSSVRRNEPAFLSYGATSMATDDSQPLRERVKDRFEAMMSRADKWAERVGYASFEGLMDELLEGNDE